MNVRKTLRQGFTLIELLVVIAIMAVLASMLFAVFSRVRESGRSASCQSNLKQIALSIQQYSADHSGLYPVACSTILISDDIVDVKRSHGWARHIQPYIKNTDVFQCPNENHDSFLPSGTDTDYAYNFFLSGIHDARLAHPSTTVLNVDWDTSSSCNTSAGAGLGEGNPQFWRR